MHINLKILWTLCISIAQKMDLFLNKYIWILQTLTDVSPILWNRICASTDCHRKICEALHDVKIPETFGHFDQMSVRILKKTTKDS